MLILQTPKTQIFVGQKKFPSLVKGEIQNERWKRTYCCTIL